MKLFEYDIHIGKWRVLIQTNDIQNGAVKARHIATGAVTGDKIGDGEVLSQHIEDEAITTAKIGDGEVKSRNIAPGAVTNEKLQDECITGDEIEGSTVKNGKLANDAVQTRNIKDYNVTTTKIAPGAITPDKAADGTIIKPVLSNTGSGVFTLLPNRLYIITEPVATAVTFALGTPIEGVVNEYLVQFTCGANAVVNFPSNIRWIDNEPLVAEPDMTYQVSIVNNLAVFASWEPAN